MLDHKFINHHKTDNRIIMSAAQHTGQITIWNIEVAPVKHTS